MQLLSHLIEQLGTKALNIVEAEAFEQPNPEADGSNLPSVADSSRKKLPELFLDTILDGHVCRCIQCEPEVLATLLDQAKLTIRNDNTASLAKEELRENIER